jgi:hypothetical protein
MPVPWRCFLALLLAFLMSGCAKQPPQIIPVEGTVTINGKPLPRARVTFIPQLTDFGAEYNSSAVTDDSGHFVLKLQSDDRSGAAVGTHIVLVAETGLPKELRGEQDGRILDAYRAKLGNRPIPPKYNSVSQSPLKIEVMPGGPPVALELTR